MKRKSLVGDFSEAGSMSLIMARGVLMLDEPVAGWPCFFCELSSQISSH